MIHEILPVGMLQCNCSIFGDEATRDAVVIDPGDDIDAIQAVLDRHGLRVTAIIITHAHIDHVGGAAKLKKLTGAPVHMNAADGALLALMDVQAGWLGVATPDVAAVDVNARDGATVKLGETSMEILHTPGHTQGSVCVWIPAEGALVAGDTLFRESIGRTDLPGGDSRAIIRSIHEKLLVLPEEVRVFPGHGPSTTIGREKALNPFLR